MSRVAVPVITSCSTREPYYCNGHLELALVYPSHHTLACFQELGTCSSTGRAAHQRCECLGLVHNLYCLLHITTVLYAYGRGSSLNMHVHVACYTPYNGQCSVASAIIHTWCCLELVLDLFCLPLEELPPPLPVAPFDDEEDPRPLSFELMMALTWSVMDSRERPERVFLLLRLTSWRKLLKSSLWWVMDKVHVHVGERERKVRTSIPSNKSWKL